MRRRTSSVIALAAAASLLVAGCSQGIGMNRVAEGTQLSIGVLDTASTVNAQEARLGNPIDVSASAEQLVAGMLYLPVHLRVHPTVQFNTDFIRVEPVGSDPLTVRHQLAEGMAWSDAVPTDDADLLLAWAAASEHFAPADFDREEHLTGDGQLTVPDDVTWFDHAWSPMQQGTAVPTVGSDRRTMDVVYDSPVLEWELGIRRLLPAHVVAREALGVSDAMVAKQAVRDAILDEDLDSIRKLADAYRELFSISGGVASGASVSNAQYMIDQIEPSGVVVLKPNKEYRIGNGAVSETIRVVPHDSTESLLDSLRAGTVNVAIPARSVEAWSTILQLDRRGYRAIATSSSAFLRLDFNFTGGPQAGQFANRDARRAFLSAIGVSDLNQIMVEAVDGISTRNSWVFGPGHPEASASAETSGFMQLTALDDNASAELLHRAGIDEPQACVLYDARSPERALQFQAMQEAAAERGWRLTDCSSDDWEADLTAGESWDVALTVDSTSGLHFDALAASFTTDGARNHSGFSSPALDELVATARREADVYKRLDALTEIDRLLVEEAVGMPLHHLPVIAINSDAVNGPSMSEDPPFIGQDAFGWEVSR